MLSIALNGDSGYHLPAEPIVRTFIYNHSFKEYVLLFGRIVPYKGFNVFIGIGDLPSIPDEEDNEIVDRGILEDKVDNTLRASRSLVVSELL